MSEIYTVAFRNVAVAAGEDLISLLASATRKIQVLAIELAANGQTTIGNYPLSLRYLTGSPAQGSGGTTPTPQNINPDGSAATATAHANDTTGATGTNHVILATQFNPINGYYWQTPTTSDDAPKCELGNIFVLSLDAAPAASINVSGTVWFKEV